MFAEDWKLLPKEPQNVIVDVMPPPTFPSMNLHTYPNSPPPPYCHDVLYFPNSSEPRRPARPVPTAPPPSAPLSAPTSAQDDISTPAETYPTMAKVHLLSGRAMTYCAFTPPLLKHESNFVPRSLDNVEMPQEPGSQVKYTYLSPSATSGNIQDRSAVDSRARRSPPFDRIRGRFSTVFYRLQKLLPKKKDELIVYLVLFVCLFFLFLVIHSFNKSGCKDIDSSDLDQYFHRLNYSSDDLLVYHGENLKSIPQDNVLDGNKCIVIERRKESVSNGKSDVGVVASNEHRTFPGSLLLANHRLVDNTPDLLVVGRAPLTYTVNLPGLTSDGSFSIVPSFSKYQAAVNRVLNSWFDVHRERSVPANFQSVESFAYSKDLLRVKFGLDFFNSIIESSIDFDAMGSGEKTIKIYKFTQIFYTVSVEPPKNPSDIFDKDVTLEEIKRKTDEKNPPVVVDSVSYGRNIYMKIETTSIEKQVDLYLSLMKLKPGMQAQKHLKDLKVQIYVVGGNPNSTELITVNETNQIRDIISKYSTFSIHNLGFPVSYSSQFINDNKKAVVHMSTDYVETVRRDTCQKGIIKLVHRPWICRWRITWTEYVYRNGSRVPKQRWWNRNNEVIKFYFESEDIEIPSYVDDLRVVAEVFTILDSWRTVIDRSHIPILPRRMFEIGDDMSGRISPPMAK